VIEQHRIWELTKDTYLINLMETKCFLGGKCSILHATFIHPSQVATLTLATCSQFEKNKIASRLASIVAKYDDSSPWIFKIEKKEGHNQSNPQSPFLTQMSIYTFLINNSPL